VPNYDAPYQITPQVPTQGSPFFVGNTFAPIIKVQSDVFTPGVLGNSTLPIFFYDPPGTQSLWTPQTYWLFADGYFSTVTKSPNLKRQIAPPLMYLPFGVYGVEPSQLYPPPAEGFVAYQYLWGWPIPRGAYGSEIDVGYGQRLPFNYSGNSYWYNYNYAFALPLVGPGENGSPLPQYFAGCATLTFGNNNNSLYGGWKVGGNSFPTWQTSLELVDSTATFVLNSNEVIWSSFYNCTIKNNYLGAPCTKNGDYNTYITIYSDYPNPNYYSLYGVTIGQAGYYITSVYQNDLPNVPAFRGPDSLSTLGYLWLGGTPGTATILSPDGSQYWAIILAPQSTSAATALAVGYSAYGCPTITCDADGTIWIASNFVNGDYTYIGNGSLNVLELTAPQPLVFGPPIPLTCFNPCNLLMGPNS
jgi:hypothetical protein